MPTIIIWLNAASCSVLKLSVLCNFHIACENLFCGITKLNFCCRGKQQYDVKWFVPLSEVQLSDKMDDTPVEWKQRVAKAEKEIQAMKSKLKDLKAQLRKAIKECKEVNKYLVAYSYWSFRKLTQLSHIVCNLQIGTAWVLLKKFHCFFCKCTAWS